MHLSVTRAAALKPKPQDESALGFGKLFTDHIFIMEYTKGKGWHDARIKPLEPFALDPATMVLHYGQGIFEGLKAYKSESGETLLFRPRDNFKRMNNSARRMCMPEIDEDFVLNALFKLLKIEDEWIPRSFGTSLYIRPTMLASDPFLGVRASENYIFYIILSPVGAYYPEGLKPVKIYVEDFYIRAPIGGLGEAKTMANYAASLLAGEKAHEKGYTQVLWLDAAEKRYVEEVGSMNIFFKLKDELVTPALVGSILPGITRSSVLEIAKRMGIPVNERRITIDEVYEAHAKGTLEEVFGTGTAAVISPVGTLSWKGNVIHVNNGEMGKLSQSLYDELTQIQYGRKPDPYGWVVRV